MLRQIASFLIILLLLCVAFVGLERLFSPSFQSCINREQNTENHNSTKENPSSLPGVDAYVICSGRFFDSHGAGIAALATIVIAAFTGTLWIATSRQAKITRSILDHTIDTDISTQRAYLARTGINTIANVTDDHKFVKKWQLMPVWTNQGRTPGKNVHFRSAHPVIVKITEDIPSQFTPIFIDIGGQTLITLGANQAMQGGHADVDADDLVRLGKKEIRIFVIFRVEYNDIFENTPIRISQHCEEIAYTGASVITKKALPSGTPLPIMFYGHSKMQLFT